MTGRRVRQQPDRSEQVAAKRRSTARGPHQPTRPPSRRRPPDRNAWEEIVGRCEEVGVDAFEINFSCPHGMPERKMGMAVGQDPDLMTEVRGRGGGPWGVHRG